MLHSADTYRIRPVSVLIQDSNYQRDDRTELERLRRENVRLRVDNERLRRYEAALRGSKVTVYTQDRERWHDLHVEPLRNEAGEIVGLSGAAVDVTERKEGEAHLRLLLRELTHRSKNLLAVIQAMARQTARHAGSTDAFLTQFNARLQALAASHDLLVRESWHGAALQELVHSQLAVYIDPDRNQITIDGPACTNSRPMRRGSAPSRCPRVKCRSSGSARSPTTATPWRSTGARNSGRRCGFAGKRVSAAW
jgi:two-component sensor histidine kinase